jgi:hypothetical protein
MFKLGLLLFPVMIITRVMKDPSPIVRFIKAGATAPDTARNPVSVNVTRRSHLDRAVRQGVLIDAGEGRFYVDVEAYRHRRRRAILVVTIGTILLTAAAWFVLHAL